MKRNLISFLLLACLLGCGYGMLAEGYLGNNAAGNLDLLAGELGLTLVGSHCTGIAMAVTCLLGLVMVWGRWQVPSRKALASSISLGSVAHRKAPDRETAFRHHGAPKPLSICDLR